MRIAVGSAVFLIFAGIGFAQTQQTQTASQPQQPAGPTLEFTLNYINGALAQRSSVGFPVTCCASVALKSGDLSYSYDTGDIHYDNLIDPAKIQLVSLHSDTADGNWVQL